MHSVRPIGWVLLSVACAAVMAVAAALASVYVVQAEAAHRDYCGVAAAGAVIALTEGSMLASPLGVRTGIVARVRNPAARSQV